MTTAMRQLSDTMVTNGAVGMVQVTRTVLPKDLTPGFMRLSLVVSVTQECSVMSDPEEHLGEEAKPTPVSSKN